MELKMITLNPGVFDTDSTLLTTFTVGVRGVTRIDAQSDGWVRVEMPARTLMVRPGMMGEPAEFLEADSLKTKAKK